MMQRLLTLLLVVMAAPTFAVTAVNPFGVNVRSSGPTTGSVTLRMRLVGRPLSRMPMVV